MALIPVCMGTETDRLSGMGAERNSMGRFSRARILSPPSMARPRGSTTRPSSSSPTGTLAMRPTRRTLLRVSICSNLPKTTQPMLPGSMSSTIPRSPHSNSTTSPYMMSARPSIRHIPSETESTRPSWNSSIRGSASAMPSMTSFSTASASGSSARGRFIRSRSRW